MASAQKIHPARMPGISPRETSDQALGSHLRHFNSSSKYHQGVFRRMFGGRKFEDGQERYIRKGFRKYFNALTKIQRLVVCINRCPVSLMLTANGYSTMIYTLPSLLAATLGPLANVASIGALVTYWRMNLLDSQGNLLGDLQGIPFRDPDW
jgi:hypothetical protein